MKTSLRVACSLTFIFWTSLPSQRVLGADGICELVEPPPVEVLVPTGPDQPAPIVTVKVQAPACTQPGKNLEYRISVKNSSPAAAHGVVIHNSIPAHARFVQASPRPHKIEPELQWNLGTLAGYGCQEIILILAPTSAEDITNCTRVQYEHGVCVTTRSARPVAPVKPATKEPTTEEPPLLRKGKLKIGVKGPHEQEINAAASYSITVTNVGNGPAKNVLISATLDEKLIFVSAKSEFEFQAGTVAWAIGDLEVNASRTVEFTAKAKGTGKMCFKTIAFANGGVKTEGDATCTTFGVSAISLQLFDSPDPIPVGGTAKYQILVQNQGHLSVTNLHIRALIPPGMKLKSVKGPVEHKQEGQTVSFEPVGTLEAGKKVEIEVFTLAETSGDQRFKIQVTADQLKEGGPVFEEESTTVYR